jgi:hypothetical protein
MDPDRSRWRIRLSTLMLLVVIAALVSYIAADRWHRRRQAQRLADMMRAVAEYERAEADAAQQAKARTAAPTE